MINIEHEGRTRMGGALCDGMARREWLRLGGLGALGLSLPQWYEAIAKAEATGNTGNTVRASAKACIQIFLWGGPGAQETWDIKPHAPDGTRGEFQPVATAVPGTQICEHLPQMAKRADQYSLIRSLTHDGVNHGTSSYHMLTGHIHWSPGTLRHPTKFDMPNIGVNAARFLKHPAYLPSHVHLPAVINDGDGLPVPGQDAGILGDACMPFRVLGDMTKKDFSVPSLALAEGVTSDRLKRRVGLAELIDRQAEHLSSAEIGQAVGSAYERAMNLLASPRTQTAFDLAAEPEKIRERYGWHHFGQALVLARRMVESGVPFVTVYWNAPSNTDDQSWDTHTNQHVRMREHLLPHFDRAMSALLDDLTDRGLLEQTLVTWYGEFGRTPKINGNGGRDHWGFCQSIGLTGGGIQPGLTHGTSTRDGGYAETEPVSPDDLAATMYRCLGIDHHQHMFDLQNRPIPLSYGEPVSAVLA